MRDTETTSGGALYVLDHSAPLPQDDTSNAPDPSNAAGEVDDTTPITDQNSDGLPDTENEHKSRPSRIMDEAEDWLSGNEKDAAAKHQSRRSNIMDQAEDWLSGNEKDATAKRQCRPSQIMRQAEEWLASNEKEAAKHLSRPSRIIDQAEDWLSACKDGKSSNQDCAAENQQESRPEGQSQNASNRAHGPGIYAIGGSQNFQRIDNRGFTLTSMQNTPMPVPPPTEESPEDQETGGATVFASSGGASIPSLVEANPVSSGLYSHMAEAEPVSPSEAQKGGRSKKTRSERKLVTLLALFALLGVGLAIALVLGIKRNNSQSESSSSLTSTPSAAPSLLSPAPTPLALSGILDQLLEDLPSYTIVSLRDPHSPQSQAFGWLLYHQNITTLPEWRKMQLFALATFYYSFDGPNWPYQINKDWLDDTKSECDWFSNLHGVISLFSDSFETVDFGWLPCNDKGVFERLVLYGSWRFQINSPTMPPELALLTGLKWIRLAEHALIDTSITDIVPPFLFQMTQLEWLDFSHDRLDGTIATEFGLLTNLSLLFLHRNSLSGSIPSELALCTKLEYLSLGSNKLAGTIPSQIGLLNNLKDFNVSEALLEGSIPSELGLLPEKALRAVNVSANSMLTGTVPEQLCSLATNASCNYDDYHKLGFWWFYGAKRSCSLYFDCLGATGLCGCDCPC